MKTEKSELEIELISYLKSMEQIIDDSFMTTKQSRVLVDKGYNILRVCERLRASRDNHATKYKELLEKFKEMKK